MAIICSAEEWKKQYDALLMDHFRNDGHWNEGRETKPFVLPLPTQPIQI